MGSEYLTFCMSRQPLSYSPKCSLEIYKAPIMHSALCLGEAGFEHGEKVEELEQRDQLRK